MLQLVYYSSQAHYDVHARQHSSTVTTYHISAATTTLTILIYNHIRKYHRSKFCVVQFSPGMHFDDFARHLLSSCAWDSPLRFGVLIVALYVLQVVMQHCPDVHTIDFVAVRIELEPKIPM